VGNISEYGGGSSVYRVDKQLAGVSKAYPLDILGIKTILI
jgi:hypothetical protein